MVFGTRMDSYFSEDLSYRDHMAFSKSTVICLTRGILATICKTIFKTWNKIVFNNTAYMHEHLSILCPRELNINV